MLKTSFIVGLLILALGFGGFSFYQYQQSQTELKRLKENPQEAAIAEAKKLVERVGKLIDLPKDEEPTVANITDAKKLSDQAFFQAAQNGDKVLIYTKAKKAILYRPSSNKVIEVAPVNLGGRQTEQKVTVALYNGTTTVGLTGTAEGQLEGKFLNVDITVKENARKNDYEKTVVALLSQGKEQEAKAIAEVLGVQVSSLPEGETKPKADILIILGSDYSKNR